MHVFWLKISRHEVEFIGTSTAPALCSWQALSSLEKNHCATGEITCDPLVKVYRRRVHVHNASELRLYIWPWRFLPLRAQLRNLNAHYPSLFLWGLFYSNLQMACVTNGICCILLFIFFPRIDIWAVTRDRAQNRSGSSGVYWLMSLRCWYGAHGFY